MNNVIGIILLYHIFLRKRYRYLNIRQLNLFAGKLQY